LTTYDKVVQHFRTGSSKRSEFVEACEQYPKAQSCKRKALIKERGKKAKEKVVVRREEIENCGNFIAQPDPNVRPDALALPEHCARF